jgi:predicted lactoylglutathione lyase
VTPLNIHESVGVTATIPNGAQQQIQSTCAVGQAVGGGWTDGQANAHVYPTESKVLDANTWQFTFANYEGSAQQVTAYTICVG